MSIKESLIIGLSEIEVGQNKYKTGVFDIIFARA
jgi:hypothetical protein